MLRVEKLNPQQIDQYEKMEREEIIEAGEDRPLIPETTVAVECLNYERSMYYRTPKIYLKCKVISWKFTGIELFMAMNEYRKVPAGSDYYEAWVIANRNVKPARQDRMSPAIFKGGKFEAVIKTVKPKFKDGSEKPDCFHYSKIDYFIKRID